MKRRLQAAAAVVAFAVIAMGQDSCDGETGGGGGSGDSQDITGSPTERVQIALEDVEGPVQDPKVKDVEFNGKTAQATVKTPKGGFDGASTQDLDWQAGAVLADIYDEAGWKGSAEVLFVGGLVDSRTGEDLPNASTGRYSISASRAKRIDWADEDTVTYGIEWSLYRDFASPALKQG